MIKADYITLFVLVIAAKLVLKGVEEFLKKKRRRKNGLFGK